MAKKNTIELNGYNLSKAWFEFAYENNSKVKPAHTALFFWIVELWNRLGMPNEFGLPSSEARQAMSVSRSDIFTGCLTDLSKWGFIQIIHSSINQHKANIIKIVPLHFVEGNEQALRRATSRQRSSNVESNVDVNKPINLETYKPINKDFEKPSELQVYEYMLSRFEKRELKSNTQKLKDEAEQFVAYYNKVGWLVGKAKTPMKDWKGAITNWFNGKDLKQWCLTPQEIAVQSMPVEIYGGFMPKPTQPKQQKDLDAELNRIFDEK